MRAAALAVADAGSEAAQVNYDALPPDAFPRLRASASLLRAYDFDAEFEFGLAALVSGFAAVRPRRANGQ